MTRKYTVSINVLAAFFLALGCFHLPIGYYTFLRIVVFIVAVVGLYMGITEKRTYWVIINGLSEVVFNPIIPVYLHDKTLWIILDVIAALWFGIQAIILLKSKKWTNHNDRETQN